MVTNFFANPEADSSDALLERLRVVTAGLYDVAGEIGRGGMAVVYIATDMRLGRKVAIKVMEPRLSFTPGMAERFLQEARIAARLQHHNIIVVHEVQQDGELIFFVMRLVEGGSLDEVCRRLAQKGQRLPLDQAQWILWQAARALSYAHSEGIVHRDVKPANILVTTKGEVVVTDFGIAKAADGEGLTKSGMAIGTPVYMSPEQFTGTDPVSGAADQYALGIAAYELLTGAPPFSGDLYRLIAAHGSAVPADLREARPDCPAPLAEAVMRMLAKKPADRWPSLDAVLPVLGQGLAIDGSSTRHDLAVIATDLQAARAASVAAWGALAPATPPWTSGSRRRTGPTPATVSISPPTGQIVMGGQLDLRAVVTADTGSTINDAVVTWTSANPAVATVNGEGSVLGISPGATTIRADVQTGGTAVVQAVAELTVTAREAGRVRIVQAEPSLECGEAMLLTAEVVDVDGVRITSPELQWSSSRPDVLHVDARGTIMALAGGLATVTARVGGVQGTVRVEVREAPVGAVTFTLDAEAVDEGADVPFTLHVADISGLARSTAGLVVVSESPEIADVRMDPPAVRGRLPGRVRLQVNSVETDAPGTTATRRREPWAVADLVVRPTVASVDVTVSLAALTVGEESTASAQQRDARGEAVPGAPAVRWRTSDERVAVVNERGVVQARGAGTVRVIAESGAHQGEETITVRAVPLAALHLTTGGRARGEGDAPVEAIVGVPVTWTARAVDVRGHAAEAAVRWTVEPAGAATVSATGEVVPRVAGTLQVVVSAPSEPGGPTITARTTLRVRLPRVTGLRITASPGNMRVGRRATLSAAADTDGGTADLSALLWSSDNDTVLRVSSSGELEAVAEGSATITAWLSTVRDSAVITVRPARSPMLLWGGVAAAAATVLLATVLVLPGGGADDGEPSVADSVSVLATDASADGAPGSPAAQRFGGELSGAANEDDRRASADSSTETSTTEGAGTPDRSVGEQPPVAQRPPAAVDRPPVSPSPRPAPPATGGTADRSTPVTSAPGRTDSAAAATPPPRPEVIGPSTDEMGPLAYEYTARLTRGEFRTGELASFFSRTTSAHGASMAGQPRAAGREGDALLVDVDVQVERTLGSGAVDRRTTRVRLVLRGRPGGATIESATPGPLTRVR